MTNAIASRHYDIFLAAPFHDEGAGDPRAKFGLFDSIGIMVESLGRKTYLPHRRVAEFWTPQELVSNIQRAMLYSDLALVYLGIPSTDVGIMIGEAYKTTMPMVHFYERGTEIDPRVPRIGSGPVKREIQFGNEKEAIAQLKDFITGFFDDNQEKIAERRSIIDRRGLAARMSLLEFVATGGIIDDL